MKQAQDPTSLEYGTKKFPLATRSGVCTSAGDDKHEAHKACATAVW